MLQIKRMTVLLSIWSVYATGVFTALGNENKLSVVFEVVCNTRDNNAQRECILQEEVSDGRQHRSWITFGNIIPNKSNGWESVVSTSCSSCGYGDGKTVLEQTPKLSRAPYILIDTETVFTNQPDGKIAVEVKLTKQKFSKYDDRATPVYVSSNHEFRFKLSRTDAGIIPIIIADAAERDAFGIDEMFVVVRVFPQGRMKMSYGTIAVQTDLPNMEVLVDGDVLARTQNDLTVMLKNIVAGKHDVVVRDLSGRSKRREVEVQGGGHIELMFTMLPVSDDKRSARLISVGKNQQGGDEYFRQQDSSFVVKIPEGEFVMGSTVNEGEPPERPQRKVVLTAFMIDKTEVTWGQFRKYSEATGAKLPPSPVWAVNDNIPVSGVLHDEARAYCEWVGGRLPTEAEWEKAARGTDGRKYPWGNKWNSYYCNGIDGGPHKVLVVGSFPDGASPYGVLDLLGNMQEWCADWYQDHYAPDSVLDPRGPETGVGRVVRGGYWMSHEYTMRAAYRYKNDPTWRSPANGFRCVMSATPTER